MLSVIHFFTSVPLRLFGKLNVTLKEKNKI